MESKTVEESKIVMARLMQPADANPSGNVHGGVIMKLVDEAGGACAIRHARQRTVTVAMDYMSFRAPVYIGDLVTVTAQITYVGRSSMDIHVFVQSLGEALQQYDGASISPHVVMPFLVVCAQSSGYQGQCDTSWAEVQNQITTRTLLLDMLTQGLNLQNWYTLASYCPGVVTTDTYLLIGTFEQETGMPLAHLGRAVLGIACSCGSSPTPLLAWQAVYFC